MRSGLKEGVSYSLSRWTDLPVAKWDWFESCLKAQQMVAFDPRTACPEYWSLAPEDTLGLVFWTKNPESLLANQSLLEPYKVAVHMTITGWHEVEKGAPSIDEAGDLLVRTAQAFPLTYWRLSPIPNLPMPELSYRFQKIAGYAMMAGIKQVFLAFLQENDLLPEPRSNSEQLEVLHMLEESAKAYGIEILLCDDDRRHAEHFKTAACVPPADFGQELVESCGCALMVDPFTINETCSFGCQYCYAADKSLSPKKRNTTRKKALPVLCG
jgi:hypothetical protein